MEQCEKYELRRAGMAEGAPPACRRLQIGDAAAMNHLETLCFSTPWSLSQCLAALAQPSFAAFGLWLEDALAAYISFYHAAPELEILNLAVDPARRREGHAAKILKAALQAGHKMGMEKAMLEVREGNVAAIALYEKFGFRQCGIRPRYYPDNGEAALLYALDLRVFANPSVDARKIQI